MATHRRTLVYSTSIDNEFHLTAPLSPRSPRSKRKQNRHQSDSASVTSSIETQSTSMSSSRRTRKSNRSSRKSKSSNWKQEWFLISLPYLCFGFLLFVVFDFVMDSFFGETYPSRQEDAYFGPALGIDYQEHFQSYGKPGWMLDESSPASSSRDWDSKYFSQHRLDQYDYDAIYSSNGKHLSYNIEDSQIQISNTYTSSDILERGCDLTVVLMDPRIPSMSFQDSVWYTLESVAAYAPYACVLLQTGTYIQLWLFAFVFHFTNYAHLNRQIKPHAP